MISAAVERRSQVFLREVRFPARSVGGSGLRRIGSRPLPRIGISTGREAEPPASAGAAANERFGRRRGVARLGKSGRRCRPPRRGAAAATAAGRPRAFHRRRGVDRLVNVAQPAGPDLDVTDRLPHVAVVRRPPNIVRHPRPRLKTGTGRKPPKSLRSARRATVEQEPGAAIINAPSADRRKHRPAWDRRKTWARSVHRTRDAPADTCPAGRPRCFAA